MSRGFNLRRVTVLSAVLIVAVVWSFAPAHALAQEDSANAGDSIQIGPLGLKPAVNWQTEYDDNVFRNAADPTSDFVSTLGGSAEVRGRMRRVEVTGSGRADWVHYATLISERGANVGSALRLDVQFNRLVPYVTGSYENSRVRTHQEIDLRPRIRQSIVGAGGVLHLGAKTALDFSARRGMVSFDDTMADGVSLRAALSRNTDQFSLSVLREVTPLTRIVLTAEQNRDTYDDAPQRGADQLRLLAGFESDGRIRGHVRAGARVHRPRNTTLPESRGYVVAVGTSVSVHERLQIGIDAVRDLVPSYRADISYYESHSYSVSLGYAVRRSLRFNAMAGRHVADYRGGSGRPSALEGAGVEEQMNYGGGLSYLLGDSMAISFGSTYVERTSPSTARRYEGLSFRAGVRHAF